MNFTKSHFLLSKMTFLFVGFCCFILISSKSSLSQKEGDERIILEYPTENPRVDWKTQRFLETLPPDSAVAVWIFFKDKGIKSLGEYQTALDLCYNQLSERSIKRRMQRGQSSGLDFTDISVKKDYLDELENSGVKIRVVSKWLNAASVMANKQQIENIKNLPFVRAVKKVVSFTRKEPSAEEKRSSKVGAIPRLWRDVPHELPLQYALGYGESYAQLAQIHVPELHNIGISGKGVLITLLDTGFFIHHPAFKHILDSGRLVATHDFINGDDDVEDQNDSQRGHGTAVWSAVSGLVNDTLVGCAYGAEFALAKTEIVSQEIQIEEDNWVAGVEWAEAIGTDVVSSSLGYTAWYTYEDMNGGNALCTQAADLAVSKGVVVVNAAGNERDDPWYYIIAPADGDSVIAVGAVDLEGKIASFSSAGPTYDGRIKPDVVACGVQTFCASSSGGYQYSGGTSFATPLVAGACALLLEAHPGANPVRLREALWKTASQADHPDNLMGYGIVDASKASGFSLVISPQELHFEASCGDTVSQQTILDLTDFWQEESLKWEASTTSEWVTISPDSGITPSTCSVTVCPKGLKVGINQGSILISAQNAIKSQQKVPMVFTLLPSAKVWAFPNPFTDSLTLFVEKSNVRGKVKADVFTVAGELLYRFPEKNGEENYQHTWDGRNEKGGEVGTGIYLLKIDMDDHSELVKLAKVK